MRCPTLISEIGKKGQIPPSSAFCSIQTFNRLDAVHPHWGGWSTLQSPPIQMLISAGNTLINTPRKMFNLWNIKLTTTGVTPKPRGGVTLAFRNGSERVVHLHLHFFSVFFSLCLLHSSHSQKSGFLWFSELTSSYQVYVLRQQLDWSWSINLSTKVSGKEPIGPLGSDVYTRSNQMWETGEGWELSYMNVTIWMVQRKSVSQKMWHSKVFF